MDESAGHITNLLLTVITRDVQWLFIMEDWFFTLYLCLLKDNKSIPSDTC